MLYVTGAQPDTVMYTEFAAVLNAVYKEENAPAAPAYVM
jgi:hypothetical protein